MIAKEHEKAKKKYSVASQATVFRRELNLPEVLELENEFPTVYARNVKQKAKHQAQVQLKQKWEDKSMHGQYPKRVNEKDVDYQMTNQWLKSGGLKSETEGLIIATQDQAIKTNYYRRNILNDGKDPMYRICVNTRKPLIISRQGALSWPKLNTYTDMTKPPHTYTGTYAKS